MGTNEPPQKKKKLLIATDNYLPRWDGVARFLHEIIPFLISDFDITIVCPDFPGKKTKEEGITVVRIPVHLFSIGDFHPPKFRLGTVRKLVRENDVVWSQSIGPIGGAGIYFGRREGKHVVSYVHSVEWDLVTASIGKTPIGKGIVSTITKSVVQWLYNKCDLLLVPSKEVKDLFEKEGILTEKRVVHLGVNTMLFCPTRNRVDAKKKVGWDPKKTYIGFHGRLGREKDLPTLQQAFARVRESNENAELVIIGAGRPDIMALFKGKGMHLLGKTDNVIPYLQAMDIYVLPSLTETTSLSTMEAMACGVAVITTPVGYIKKYILPGYNGYLFTPKDVDDLVKKLEGLVKNEEHRNTIGKNARKTIVNHYRWQQTVRNIRTVLKGVEKELVEEENAQEQEQQK